MNIHLGWVGSAPPESVLAAVEAARKVSPSSVVMFHDDEREVPTAWRETMDKLKLRSHMRSDVQRHAILKRYGGLWLDADVRLLADPVEWTAGWDRYTAIRLRRYPHMIGTDIIFVPPEWNGWKVVDDEITAVLEKTLEARRVSVLALAHAMIEKCRSRMPDAFSILEPGSKFPFDATTYAADSVVARGFDPPAPGLGDMIASGLSKIGITKELAQSLASKVGIADCGCGKRQALANSLGHKLLGLPPGSTASDRNAT